MAKQISANTIEYSESELLKNGTLTLKTEPLEGDLEAHIPQHITEKDLGIE